jgi:hypothetical protein
MTPGNQTVTATDTAGGITGSAAVSVNSPGTPPGDAAGRRITPGAKVDKVQEIALLDRFFRLLAAGAFPSG